jgi:hypothetical protein
MMLFALTTTAVGLALTACARTQSGEAPVTVLGRDNTAPPQGGIAPDKEADILLVLQQRETSTRKCYQDVLNEKQDRAFAGSMKVLIGLGTGGEARDVKIVGGSLSDADVAACLVDTIKRFEFPKLDQPGEVQYEFQFRPAY